MPHGEVVQAPSGVRAAIRPKHHSAVADDIPSRHLVGAATTVFWLARIRWTVPHAGNKLDFDVPVGVGVPHRNELLVLK